MPNRAIDYGSIADPLADSMGMVAKSMLRAPQIRYRLDQEARKLASQQMVDAAQAGNYNAQARGHTARAVGDEQRNAAFDRLNTGGGIAKLHGMISGTTPFDPAEYDAAMSDASLAFGVSGRDFIELLKQGAQSAAAKTGVPARKNAEATGDITQIANNDSDNATAITNQNARNATSTANNQERLKYSLNRPITVSRDSGVWNPETQDWDVPKPERPEGNVNNLYDPATRGALTKLGERLAIELTANSTNAPNTQAKIDAIKNRARVNLAPSALPQRKLRSPGDFNAITAPAANQEQDPNDSEMMDETTMPAAQPPAAGKPLDAATAKQLLQEAGGDKNKARELAKARGYTF